MTNFGEKICMTRKTKYQGEKNKKPLVFFRGCCYNESTLENR